MARGHGNSGSGFNYTQLRTRRLHNTLLGLDPRIGSLCRLRHMSSRRIISERQEDLLRRAVSIYEPALAELRQLAASGELETQTGLERALEIAERAIGAPIDQAERADDSVLSAEICRMMVADSYGHLAAIAEARVGGAEAARSLIRSRTGHRVEELIA